MTDSNDHDLLIELKTMVTVLISQQNQFMTSSQTTMTGLSERLYALEAKDRGDSEKVRAIDINVQRSLDNHEKIASLETEVANLKSKANLWDIANSVGIAITAALSYFR